MILYYISELGVIYNKSEIHCITNCIGYDPLLQYLTVQQYEHQERTSHYTLCGSLAFSQPHHSTYRIQEALFLIHTSVITMHICNYNYCTTITLNIYAPWVHTHITIPGITPLNQVDPHLPYPCCSPTPSLGTSCHPVHPVFFLYFLLEI